MSTTFKPFGLKPVYHPSGLDRAVPFVGTNTYNPVSYTHLTLPTILRV